jgi:hypothetical protein
LSAQRLFHQHHVFACFALFVVSLLFSDAFRNLNTKTPSSPRPAVLFTAKPASPSAFIRTIRSQIVFRLLPGEVNRRTTSSGGIMRGAAIESRQFLRLARQHQCGGQYGFGHPETVCL